MVPYAILLPGRGASDVRFLKDYLRRFPVVFRVLKRGYRLFFPPQPLKTRKRLQERIENCLSRHAGVFFVQVGSNDGRQGDPLHDLIVAHKDWRGIFIEPVPFVFERLKRNYGRAPRFVFENVAVGSQRGVAKFYYVSEKARGELGDALPYWYDQLGSFDRGHIVRHSGKLVPYIVEEELQCVPLRDILDRNAVEAVDLLHVDAEGFDYGVIAQVPFERWKPSLILFEHQHLSVEERRACRSLLKRQGYRLREFGGDTLARLIRD
jgi:FkbM family methyltransferase